MRVPVLYRLLRPLARALARLFHRRLRVEHPERVPLEGPVVLAANHPNMMLDVLLLAASSRRALHFLAKGTLFRNPALALFLRACGVLPVHRKNEGTGNAGENLRTFEACHELLASGGALAIFPEGLSHERDAVLPLKTGCARIVLEAESKRGFALGTLVVPVGLVFSERERFRSDALVVFGEPLDPSPHYAPYRRGRKPEAVRALTGELETALASVTRHVPREEDEKLLRTLRQFFTDRSFPESSTALELDRTLVDAIADFRDRKPLEYSRLRREVLGFGRVLETLGLTHGELERSYRIGAVLRYLGPRLLLAVVGLVPFVAGALFHFLPYRIPSWIARARGREPVERGTIKLLSGLLTFPLFYALGAALLARLAGWRTALAAVGLLPVLGLFALLYAESAGELLREVRIFFFQLAPDTRVARLKSWRRSLLERLSARRREYESLEKELRE